jgi:hypothetical protein
MDIDIDKLWKGRKIEDGNVIISHEAHRKIYEFKNKVNEVLDIDEIIERANGDMEVIDNYLQKIDWDEVTGLT